MTGDIRTAPLGHTSSFGDRSKGQEEELRQRKPVSVDVTLKEPCCENVMDS
jgi:hypothetical protein